MTEQEWLASVEPESQLEWLVRRGRATERKARLFACACCRRIWPLLNEISRHALEIAERFADGHANLEDLYRADELLQEFQEQWVYPSNNTWADDARVRYGVSAAQCAVTFYREHEHGVLHGAGFTPEQAAFAVGPNDVASAAARSDPEKAQQTGLARDIFGNPFRPISFDPEWRSDTAVSLAKHIYEARDFAQMPILADALQDAGCNNADILNHCRDANATHVRGCWVVDLVLGKT